MTRLDTARQALARSFDDLEGPFTASAGAANSVTVPSLINATTGASANRFNGAYVTVGGQTRVVRAAGYTPSTGVLLVDPAWPPASIPTNGQSVEITRRLPGWPQAPGDVAYVSTINLGLNLLDIEDEVSLAITTATDITFSSAVSVWLVGAERIRAIWEPASITGGVPLQDSIKRRQWRVIRNGESTLLRTRKPFTSTSGSPVLTVDVSRPAWSWVDTGGGYADSTAGLAADADVVVPLVEDIVAVSRVEVLTVLIARSQGRPDGQDWRAQLQAQVQIARGARGYNRAAERPQVAAVPDEVAA